MDPGSSAAGIQAIDASQPPKHSFGKYLKRLKSAFKFRGRPNKSPKHAANSYAGDTTKTTEYGAYEPPQPPPLIPQSAVKQISPQDDVRTDHPTVSAIETLPSEHAHVSGSGEVKQDTYGQEREAFVDQKTPDVPQIPEPPRDHRTRRAADLFARYGYDMDPDMDPYKDKPLTAGQIQRVEKPIVVRVHHHCHHCRLAIGPTKVCVNCGHKLCKKCHQFPDNKPGGSLVTRGRKREAPSPTRSETLDNWLSGPPSSLAMRPAAKEQPHTNVFLTRKVRKLCHLCSFPFIWTERVCQNCEHVMCFRCPYEIPASSLTPESSSYFSSTTPPPYRGRERIFKKPRLRLRYNCERCSSNFEEFSNICATCGHAKCANCLRNPPRRESHPEPNSDILDSLKRRLGNWTVPTPSTPGS